MESSPEKVCTRATRLRPLLGACVLLGACAIGGGDGSLEGSFDVENCGSDDGYRMKPSFFGAATADDQGPLEIRVQRGSGQIAETDGLYILVRDAYDVQQNHLGEDFPLGSDDGPVGATLYLNRSCPEKRDLTPVALPATGGSLRFDAIYAPEGNDSDVEIAGELNGATFVDPRNAGRSASLSGYFRFLYQRGRPAQTFP